MKVIYFVAQFLVCALVSLYANLNAITVEYLYKRHPLGSSSYPLYEEPSISGVPCSHFLTDSYFDVGTLQLKYAQKKAMAFCNLLIILILRCLVDCYIENTVHVFSCSNLPLPSLSWKLAQQLVHISQGAVDCFARICHVHLS